MPSETPNRFDRISRKLALDDTRGFFPWLITDFRANLSFRTWKQTQTAPDIDDPEYVGDTVAELKELLRAVAPWLCLIEWQTQPDSLMFGRLLTELGQLWLQYQPDENPGDRYNLAAAVINLTGTSTSIPASYECRLPGPDGVETVLRVRERYLAEESADLALQGVEQGRFGKSILPLIVLMKGGSDPGIIERWLVQARMERDDRKRANLGVNALILAELTDWYQTWEDALRDWNVIESRNVLRWKDEARKEGLNEGRDEGRKEGIKEGAIGALQGTLKTVLQSKFGSLPTPVVERIEGIKDTAALQDAIVQAPFLDSLDKLSLPSGS